jgi:Uncharacterised protein family (UPF0236)
MRRLFPPPPAAPGQTWENKGSRSIQYLTVNGPVQITRTVYWNRQHGSVTPVDTWLGMNTGRYSVGVRQFCCREAAESDFRTAAEDLACVGQIVLSPETVRRIVEAEGRRVVAQQRSGSLGPAWTAADCRPSPQEPTCVITGADGFMVPLVTQAEKDKRRQGRARRRPGQPKRRRMARGSDLPYKEFKLVAFYDPAKEHQYAVGTSGNAGVLGQRMRREAAKLHLDQADLAYSVSDGADWIRKQYRVQLPMLKVNILDYYHLRDRVITVSQAVYGQGTLPARQWREQICGCLWNQGPEAALGQITRLYKTLRAAGKRKALEGLRKFITARKEMLDYPQFRAAGYDTGSGPTEAFCKTLTSRLKGQGMRWDKPNAEAMMGLASVRSSGLWDMYWDTQRKILA